MRTDALAGPPSEVPVREARGLASRTTRIVPPMRVVSHERFRRQGMARSGLALLQSEKTAYAGESLSVEL